MQKTLVDSLYQRRITNLIEYSQIMLKSLYEAKTDNKETIKTCMCNYYDKFVFGSNDKELSKHEAFYNENNIKNTVEQKFIYIILEDLVGDRKISTKVTNDLIMLSKVLAAAILIENNMVNINGKNKNFTDTMNAAKEKHFIFEGDKWDDVRGVRKKLREKISKNKKYLNKIVKEVFKDDFNLEFYQLYALDYDDKLFIKTKFEFDKSELKEFDERLIKQVYLNNDYIIGHTIIHLQKVILYNYQWMVTDEKKEGLIIELDNKVFEKKANINKLLKVCSDEKFISNIVFKIDPILFDEKTEYLTELKEQGYMLATYDFKFVDQNTRIIEENVNFVFLEKEQLKGNLKISSLAQDIGMVFIDIERQDVPLLMGM